MPLKHHAAATPRVTRSLDRLTLCRATLCGALLLGACTVPKRGPITTPTPNLLADVRDHTGAAVARDALVGHWTVMWFYPKAQTSG